MDSRLTIACVSMAVLLGVPLPAPGQQNPYRLKEPDQKKICLACHSDFEQKLKKAFVHTPVKTGECSGCHDAHVSTHSKLLSGDARKICVGCHDRVVPANAKSAHKVVVAGDCQKCHDPHASGYPANLLAKGNDLCLGCHQELGAAIKSAKFKHSPVEQGCLSCHGPHGSDKSDRLLKTGVPALCVGCHKPDSPVFQARHMKYPVAKASCTSCHDPHGSSQPALLLGNVHAPVGAGSCNRCHEAPDSPTPFATKQSGYQLCKGCHNDMVNATLAKSRLHWPVADKRGCVNCHSPHASRYTKLLKQDTPGLCGACHADTLQRISATRVKHAPVEGGTCVACHSPHGSNGAYLFEPSSVIKLCTNCHDYETHSAHPIGEKAVDPRNKNLRVDCLSCHKGHGTPFKRMLLAETNAELCTRCHKKYAR
jgi:predicted CXXCH cytochrome family protein